MKEALKEIFTFSKNQTRAILILSVLILIALVGYNQLQSFITTKEPVRNEAWINQARKSVYIDSSFKRTSQSKIVLKPFAFNPNKVSKTALLKMGLPERVANTILNYRNKGGKFYSKADVKKMYSLSENAYKQLEPYISIPKSERKRTYGNYETPKNKKTIVHINTATSIELEALRGIGQKLASNIIKYRKLLGGYARIEQIKEVYGVSPDTYNSIKSQLRCNGSIKNKININEATYYEMRKHPYLRENDWALAITRFRKSQDYEIRALEDLLEIEGMNKEVYDKIVPYLSVQ